VIVVDSSVAFKWFVAEPDVDAAMELLRDEQLLAPDLIIPEVMNAVWKIVRRGVLSQSQIVEVEKRLPNCFSEIVPTRELAKMALDIAFELDHPVYDGFYIALAERAGTHLITADERLQRKVKRTRFTKFVRPLVP
jgi:predicted nucleic acid-binding protein